MKKIQKNKKGFTLIEMVLVIAIIVILASVMVISVTGYLGKASAAKVSLSQHNASLDAATSELVAAGG